MFNLPFPTKIVSNGPSFCSPHFVSSWSWLPPKQKKSAKTACRSFTFYFTCALWFAYVCFSADDDENEDAFSDDEEFEAELKQRNNKRSPASTSKDVQVFPTFHTVNCVCILKLVVLEDFSKNLFRQCMDPIIASCFFFSFSS